MSTWSFYDLTTGLLTGRRRTRARLGNVPSGCGAVEGTFDRLTHRVDLVTGKVVEHFHDELDRKLKSRRAASAAKAEIDRLERAQLRPMRELAIDPTNATAKKRLEDIDAAIAEKRRDLGTRLGE